MVARREEGVVAWREEGMVEEGRSSFLDTSNISSSSESHRIQPDSINSLLVRSTELRGI